MNEYLELIKFKCYIDDDKNGDVVVEGKPNNNGLANLKKSLTKAGPHTLKVEVEGMQSLNATAKFSISPGI